LLSLASAFAVQLVAGLVLRLFASKLIAWAERFDPARAAAVMLAMRWLPGLLGVFVAGFLCVPSYLRLEEVEGDEEMGFLCLGLAALAVLSYLIPVMRTTISVLRSERRLRTLLMGAEQESNDVSIIRQTSPAMALVGLFKSRVVVSREVMGLLTRDQMDAALEHERAHSNSGDNYKRLVLQCAPIDGSSRKLRGAWARFTEWAADDQSTGGDSAKSVALASALVSVARLKLPPCAVVTPHASLLVADESDLRLRVERLLEPKKVGVRKFPALLVCTTGAALAMFFVAVAQQPAVNAFVHEVLEALVG
jgi:hypothetical protein